MLRTTMAPTRCVGGIARGALAQDVLQRRLCSTSRALALRRKRDEADALLTPTQRAVRVSRAAERRRFGLPVWQILSGGLVGVGFVTWWYAGHRPARGWNPEHLTEAGTALLPTTIVTEQCQVEALLSEVRVVLGRLGIGLGTVPLHVKLLTEAQHPHNVEGLTQKVVRPPPVLRGIEAVSLRPGLTAIHAAQVLAHEYMHCWLVRSPLSWPMFSQLCSLRSSTRPKTRWVE